jgi:hypothetical protein
VEGKLNCTIKEKREVAGARIFFYEQEKPKLVVK